MLHIDIDRWRTDSDVVARIEAAARRERAQLMNRYLTRFGAWLRRTPQRERAATECTA